MNDVEVEEKYVELKKEIATVRQELKELKNNVDKHMIHLKAYVNNSTKLIIDELRSSRSQPTQTTEKELEFRIQLTKQVVVFVTLTCMDHQVENPQA